MKEAAYGVVLTGSKKEVEFMDRIMKELKMYAFIDESMGPNDFIQDCFQRGYNEYLKELSVYLETI
jgi:hypothetical protein